MNITIRYSDMRGVRGKFTWDVVDADTGKIIGSLTEKSPQIERTISLFGGTYEHAFKTPDECLAFALGVQAVIERLLPAENLNPFAPAIPVEQLNASNDE